MPTILPRDKSAISFITTLPGFCGRIQSPRSDLTALVGVLQLILAEGCLRDQLGILPVRRSREFPVQQVVMTAYHAHLK